MAIIISTDGGSARKVDQSPPQEETELQEYIFKNPMALPISEIASDAELLVLATEFPIEGDRIDVLAIDNRGSIYIIETKLYKNPDKRKVVAQVLDYGAALWKSYGGGDGFLVDVDRACAAQGAKLRERIAAQFGYEEIGIEELLGAVRRNLADGNLRFIVLMDKLHDRLRDLIIFLNEKSRFSIYAVEMEFYRHDAMQIVIPKLFGAQVIKDAKGPTDARYQWDESRFVEDVQAGAPEFMEAARRLVTLSRELGRVEFKNADFHGRHAKLNILLPPLGPRPICNLWSEDATLTLIAEASDKADAARAFRREIVERLVIARFCPAPTPDDEGELELEGADWASKIDTLEQVLRQAFKSAPR